MDSKLIWSETFIGLNISNFTRFLPKVQQNSESHHFHMKAVSSLLFTYASTAILTSLWLSSGSVLPNITPSPILHLFTHMETQTGWLKLGSSLPLDGLPFNAECYCVTEVLLTSCPASQSSSPKLLGSVYPPAGTSVGGSGVGGSIRIGSYWKGRKWLEMKPEVLQLKSWWTTSRKAEEIEEYK